MRRNKTVNIRLINKIFSKFNDYRNVHTNTAIKMFKTKICLIMIAFFSNCMSIKSLSE